MMTTEERLLPATPMQALTFLRHAMWHVEFITRDDYLQRTGESMPYFALYNTPARNILVRAFALVCMGSDICMYCQNQPELGKHCYICGRG